MQKKSNIRRNCLTRHLWLLLLLASWVPVPQVRAQSPKVEIRHFDPAKLDRFRNDPRFQYRRDTPKPPKKRPKRKEKREKQVNHRVYHSPIDLSGIGKVILWILIIGGGVFLISQVLKVRFRKLLKKKSDEAEVVYVGELEDEVDIRSMEFESLLDRAIREQRFRYAVRLLYLQSLRQLTERGLISWRQEKTNHQYLRELGNAFIRPKFSEVTFLFEYIWYGEFPVDKDHFNAARASFIQLEQAIRKTDAG